jgi:hypothetical protein
VGALLWGAAPVVAWAGPAPAALSEAERALGQAQESGQRVEVVGQRTESTTTYANPDGFSFTLDQATAPVRVKRSDSSWVAPDATLHWSSDGSVAPAAAVVDLRFSSGGSAQPLVSIGWGGRSLALMWPGSLPVPVLDGDSAVYADVLPDVDLRMTATVEGFHEVLVVKTRAAAADSRVKRIQFGMSSDGLTVRSTAGGGLSAAAPGGQDLFTSPPAQVWDSAGDAATADAQEPVATAAADGRADAEAPEADDAGSGASGPAPGAHVATAPLAVGDDSLTLVPNADVLATTDASAFPLFIDPDVSLNSGAPTRTLLRDDGYTSYGWGNGDDDRGKGDGHCGSWEGYYCGPGYTQRLYFQFSPTALKGKKVLKATFRVTSPWAFQCDPRVTNLERTNNISSSTTWSTRPAELDLMVDRTFSAGRGSACDPDSPPAPIEFTDSSSETNENLTPTVADFAAGKFSKLTLELRAKDESDTSAWKRFKNDAVLSVNFVANPALPTSVGIVSGSSPVCHTSSADPQVVSDPTPLVSGRPQTASGGESGARLRLRWRVDVLSAGTWSTAFTDVTRPTSGFVGDNVVQNASLPTLTDGVMYRLKALTLSYEDNQTAFLNTDYTTPCYFTVDSSAPKAPGITFDSTYTECLPNACVSGGGPGVPGTVTFTAASGDTDTNFEYKLSPSDTWTAVAASAGSVTITPQLPGTYHLEVRGQDSLGRRGAETVKDFLVAAGAGPVGQWHFDEAGGDAVDTSSTVAEQQHNATLSTGAVRDDNGRRGDLPDGAGGTTPDKGLHLDGALGYAATSGPVLETRSAYTVSAWVKLNSLGSNAIVLSQDGQTYSPFILAYDVSVGAYFFGVKEEDAADGDAYHGVHSDTPAKAGVWTYLAGSYDPATGQSELYVNGISQGTESVMGSWSATGPLQIGRYKWATYQYYFDGSIDEVKVWQRALTKGEIAVEARLPDGQGNRQVELVGSWQPAGQTGTAVADTTSGYDHSLDLRGGASLTGDGLVLDGTDGAATTTGQLVDDTGSFTVAAEVALSSTVLASKPDGYTAQIVGQRDTGGSAWGLWYELVVHDGTTPLGLWHFGRLNADGTFTGATSDDVAELDTPVQITGVFDAQDGVVRLYVGAEPNNAAQAFSPLVATGDFTVGEGPDGTGWGHYLPGTISDLRIWAGAMADEIQVGAVVGG